MTTLAEFYSIVSGEVRRGSSFDSIIPLRVKQAVRWMERKYTFKYMEHFASLTIDADAVTPRALSQPSGFKSMIFWRIVNSDGSFSYLTQVDARDMSKVDSAKPKGFWQDGIDYFWLDSTPDQDYSTEMGYVARTLLPTDTSEEPYVIDEFSDIILAHTMVLLSPQLRDPNILALYKNQRDEAMLAAIDADVEDRQMNRNESMQYGWEFKEQVNQEGTTL